MARAGVLLISGALAVIATTATIGLEIASCSYAADDFSLTGASGAAAALESVALVVLAILGTVEYAQTRIPSSWVRSRLSFISQLFICIVAASTSIGTLIMQKSTSEKQDDSFVDIRRNIFVGLAIVLTFAVVFQTIFFSAYFLVYRHIALKPLSPSFQSHEDNRSKHIKGIRYSQTTAAALDQEMASVKRNDYLVNKQQRAVMGPIDYLRASVTQAIRPTYSRTKINSKRRRSTSLGSIAPRTSVDTSFDSWDTSSVDAHNRQAVLELSLSPTSLKMALETIPASPSGTLTCTRPATPFDLESLEPPRVLRRTESYDSSLHSQHEANSVSHDGSVDEMHIHPLFRSCSPTPPTAATTRTSLLTARQAGQIMSYRGSPQPLKRLRSGSLPVGRSPLTHQTSHRNVRRSETMGYADRSWTDTMRSTPPAPDWLSSQMMNTSTESFKEHRDNDKDETSDVVTNL